MVMRLWRCSLIVAVVVVLLVASLVAASTPYKQQHNFPLCNIPPSSYCGRVGCGIWYVSPLKGNDTSGLGTKASPWRDINYVINTKLEAYQANAAWNNILPQTNIVLKNVGAPIKGGDVIVLVDGWQKINIGKIVNRIPVTITREPGSPAVVDKATLTSCTNFTLACLNITSSVPTSADSILNLYTYFYFGPNNQIKIFNNSICSFFDIGPMSTNQTLLNQIAGTAINTQGFNHIVTGNYLYNIRRGVSMTSSYTYVAYNHINYVFGDSFRITDNHTIVEYNLATNSMNVDGGADHRDGLQMFTINPANTLFNITINNNKFIADYDHNRPFPEYFQGITSFDTYLEKVVVTRNLVVSSTFHGIALYSATNCQVIGNTLIDPTGTDTIKIWVSFDNKANHPVSKNNIAINNIMEVTNVWTSVVLNTGNTIAQLTLAAQDNWFVSRNNSDYHLRNVAGSPFIGKGNSTVESVYSRYDLDGLLRATPYDVGAYNILHK